MIYRNLALNPNLTRGIGSLAQYRLWCVLGFLKWLSLFSKYTTCLLLARQYFSRYWKHVPLEHIFLSRRSACFCCMRYKIKSVSCACVIPCSSVPSPSRGLKMMNWKKRRTGSTGMPLLHQPFLCRYPPKKEPMFWHEPEVTSSGWVAASPLPQTSVGLPQNSMCVRVYEEIFLDLLWEGHPVTRSSFVCGETKQVMVLLLFLFPSNCRKAVIT